MPPRPSDNAHGGRPLEEEEELRKQKKARSASGELDGPLNEPKATLFEEVQKAEDVALPVFEPVSPDEPHVVWDTEEDHEMAEERFEALVDELFTVLDDPEDVAVFEEVLDSLGWSEGEVIWEGMDFDQVFSDPGEFHDFELLSKREQRRFLRDRLRTQQASFGVEASDDLFLPRLGRQEQNVERLAVGALAEAGADVGAVHAGHHPIQHEESRGVVGGESLPRLGPVAGDENLVAGLFEGGFEDAT